MQIVFSDLHKYVELNVQKMCSFKKNIGSSLHTCHHESKAYLNNAIVSFQTIIRGHSQQQLNGFPNDVRGITVARSNSLRQGSPLPQRQRYVPDNNYPSLPENDMVANQHGQRPHYGHNDYNGPNNGTLNRQDPRYDQRFPPPNDRGDTRGDPRSRDYQDSFNKDPREMDHRGLPPQNYRDGTLDRRSDDSYGHRQNDSFERRHNDSFDSRRHNDSFDSRRQHNDSTDRPPQNMPYPNAKYNHMPPNSSGNSPSAPHPQHPDDIRHNQMYNNGSPGHHQPGQNFQGHHGDMPHQGFPKGPGDLQYERVSCLLFIM